MHLKVGHMQKVGNKKFPNSPKRFNCLALGFGKIFSNHECLGQLTCTSTNLMGQSALTLQHLGVKETPRILNRR